MCCQYIVVKNSIVKFEKHDVCIDALLLREQVTRAFVDSDGQNPVDGCFLKTSINRIHKHVNI